MSFREYSFNPILDEKEEVIGLSVFSKDITEAKQAENQKIIQNILKNNYYLFSCGCVCFRICIISSF